MTADWMMRNVPWLLGAAGYVMTNIDWFKLLSAAWIIIQMVPFVTKWLRKERRRRQFIADNPKTTVPADLE